MVAQVPGVKFFMQAGQDITVGGRLSRTEYQYTLTDTDIDELNHWAPIFEQRMAKLPGLQDVASDQQIAAPHIAIEIDRDAACAARHLAAARSTTRSTTPSARASVGNIYTSTNQYRIILEVQPQFQTDADGAVEALCRRRRAARACRSAPSPISTTKVEPLSVNHQGQFPAVTLVVQPRAGHVARPGGRPHQRDARPSSRRRRRSQGTFQGTAQAFQRSLTSTPLLVAAAILVVYIVLGMLYESYIHPITILSALPSAGVGALLVLMLFRYDLSVIAIIGIILLIGIVKKNAIMMIDFALEAERNQGKSPLEAIHQACLLRFRPIMMTTMAALFARLAAGDRPRRRLGAAPAARHRHRRRPAGLAVADALHDAGDLSLSRPVEPVARGPAAARPRRARPRRCPSPIAPVRCPSPSPAPAE